MGLIEFDKDAADTLKCNRHEWRVINDDIANISCLDLQEYFGLQKENSIYCLVAHLANHFHTPEKDWGLKMLVAHCFITMQSF